MHYFPSEAQESLCPFLPCQGNLFKNTPRPKAY